jgi:hypothetical protein
MKLLYQVHKWLAVVALAATAAWFVSGTAMVLPQSFRSVSTELDLDRRPNATATPRFEDAAVTLSTAISAVRAYVGKPLHVDGVRLRRFPGHLAYEVFTNRGIHLVDAVQGGVFQINEQFALQIAGAAGATRGALGPPTLLTRNTFECPGRLPTYRIAVDDGDGTVLCVSTGNGTLEASNRRSRAVRLVTMWHDFGPLRALMGPADVQVLLLAFAFLGTLMSAAGTLILLVQLQRWWQARRQRSNGLVTNA